MAADSETCQGCDRPVASEVAFCCSWCASASQEGRPSFHVAACNNAHAPQVSVVEGREPRRTSVRRLPSGSYVVGMSPAARRAARLAAMSTEQPEQEQHDELDVDAQAASDALEARARESYQDAVRLDAFAPDDARQGFLEGYVRGSRDRASG